MVDKLRGPRVRAFTRLGVPLLASLALAFTACSAPANTPEPEPTPSTPSSESAEPTPTTPAFTPYSPGELTVLIGTDFLPGWMQGDAPGVPNAGVEYELAEQIARVHGLKTVYRTSGWAAMTSGTMTDYDIALWTIFKTPEREEVNDYSECYYPGYTGILTRKETDVSTVDKAKDLVWGAAQGSLQAKMVDAIDPKEPGRVFSDTPAMFALLQNGEIDAVMAGLTASSGRAMQPGWEDFHVAAVVEAASVPDPCYAVQLPKGSANTGAVNDVIATVKADGTFDKWVEKNLTPLGADPSLYPTFLIP